MGALPAAPPPQASVGAAVVPPTSAPAGLGSTAAKQAAKALGGAGAASTIAIGLAGLKAQELAVTALGANTATRDAVRVFGAPATLGFVAQRGTEEAAKALGLPKELAKDLGQVVGITAPIATIPGVGIAAVAGVASLKLAGEGASALIGAVAGKDAEKAVRGAVSQLDPFKNGSAANQLLGAVGSVFFGKREEPKRPPPRPRPVNLSPQAQARQDRAKRIGEVRSESAVARKRGQLEAF